MKNDFSYIIDYDKEIQNDIKTIEFCDNWLNIFNLTEKDELKYDDGFYWSTEVACVYPEAFGLTNEEWRKLRFYIEFDEEADSDPPKGKDREWFTTGKQVEQKIISIYGETGYWAKEEIVKMRKKAVAAKSRHTRNKKKYGK